MLRVRDADGVVRRHLGAGLALACAACSGGGGTEGEGWNVLLVTLDTTRADAVSCYGGPAGVTPTIDALAAEGFLFERAVTPIPLTLPAHATLLSSLEPYEHGVHNNGYYKLAEKHATLTEVLSEAGYSTGAFIGAFVLDAQYGLAQGFDHYDAEVGDDDGSISFHYAERTARETTDAALAWLRDQDTERPFFTWVHYYDPHYPNEPPEEWRGRFRSGYLEEIAACDAEIGRLLDAVRERGDWDRTLVVVTADHGEGRGEHGEATHGYFLYQSTQHVPLVFRVPGRAGGERIEDLARLADVMPTVLGALGLEGPRTGGRDLFGDGPAPLAVMETQLPRTDFGLSALRASFDGRYKLIAAPQAELYDLIADPRERNDLAGSHADLVEQMKSRLGETGSDAQRAKRFDPGAGAEEAIAALGYSEGLDDAQVTVEDWSLEQLVEWVDLRSEGTLKFFDGDVEGSVATFERLSEACPDSYTGHHFLGMALAATGRYERALASLERANAIQPDLDPDVLFNIAVCHHFLGHPRKAVKALLSTVAVQPTHRSALQKLAAHFLQNGDRDRAGEYLRALVESWPDEPEGVWAKQLLGS